MTTLWPCSPATSNTRSLYSPYAVSDVSYTDSDVLVLRDIRGRMKAGEAPVIFWIASADTDISAVIITSNS